MPKAPVAADLLPDITIWEAKLTDNAIDTTTLPGRKLVRLSTGTPNIGTGRLELRGGAVVGTQQQVNQRVFRDDGTYWERPAGTFTYHPSHNHIHFDGWCRYRLRAKNPDGSVGAILAEGQKTSFCILDLTVHNSSHPNYVTPPYYGGCGATTQGLTPGWADVYGKSLTDQWVDVTGIADGDYFLEAEVDPDGFILEADETNNIGRIPYHLGSPPALTADAYEENDSRTFVDGRPEAGVNSPNLGVVNAQRTLNLTMQATDDDWFKFKLNATGGSGDYVGITSVNSGGDIDLRLYNSAGTQIGASESGTNTEQITLSGRAAGTYYVRIWPYSGTNPGYTFTIKPSGNQSPTVNITQPQIPIYVERSYETFPIGWTTTDPENDPRTVSIFRDRDNVFDKTTQEVTGYQNLPSTDLLVNMNTAEMDPGNWFYFLRVSDGGLTQTKVTRRPVVIYIKGDWNYDGHVHQDDYDAAWGGRGRQNFVRAMTPKRMALLDYDRDGDVDGMDEMMMIEDIEHHH
ncbi:MAG: pre-peptidase C-terminal domain-containing protein [Chthonomonas sp.]|nr:pre-peptidase C-terminal domain-containing protein [Chthonomonas sp.]